MTISTNTNSHWLGSGRRRGGCWAHPWGGSRKGALTGQGWPSRAGFQELGKRSASAPQVCVRRGSKTAHRACECRLQMKGARDDDL
eukprot:357904-Pleurochrysis_carterae.AAC.2